MKKTVCMALMLLGTLSASGQHYIGVKGGYGGAQGRVYSVYGVQEGAMVWNKYTAGVMWRYYSPQRIVGGISAELEYQQRGYRIFDGLQVGVTAVVSDTTSYRAKTRTVSSITLPVIWQPHLYMMNRKVRIFLSAGVTVTYNLGLGDTWTETKYYWNAADRVQTSTAETTPYKMQTARDVRWNYGWLGGFGVGVSMGGRWEVVAEGRYYYGMSDILRNDTKYRFNEERSLRSELDNLYITLGVYFRLGKGDITEPPLRKRRAASVSGSDFRNIK